MRFLHVTGTALFIVACGGTGGTPLDGGNDGTAGNDSGNDSGNDASSDVASDTSGDTGAQCPNESGLYSVAFSGQGCGNVSNNAPICITETSCTITLATKGSGGSNEVSGTTPILNDGSFTGAAINEGSMNRTGCVATWDNGSSTLTIDCGGTGTSQSCRATLVRTNANCN
jgi:hypothetical protein